MRRGKIWQCLKHKVPRVASISTVLPRANPDKERGISGISQSLHETGGRNLPGKGGVDTVLPSTEVWQLASMDWEAGWEGSEVQQERKVLGKSPSPADGQRSRQPLTKELLGHGAVGRNGSCKGCACSLRPPRLPGSSQCPADTQKSKKRVCIPSSKAQLGLQIQMYGQNVNAL